MIRKCLIALFAAGIACQLPAAAESPRETVSLAVTVRDGRGKPLQGAAISLSPYNLWGVTDANGTAMLREVPYGAGVAYRLKASLLGYRTREIPVVLNPAAENSVAVTLEEESLAIKEVEVVARRSGRTETSSHIGRQAIEHLQATTLGDVLQLLPGKLAMYNQNLNVEEQFRLRTLVASDYNAFGSSVMIDGIPLSANATMGVNNSSSWESSGGVDLRAIGVDDVESVEVIRGIASVEFGDVAGGTMIVNTKSGVTDLTAKGKIMPGITQFSVGKGLRAGKTGTLNVSFDYAHGRSDPRYLTDTYDRLSGNVTHSFNLMHGKWIMTNKLRATGIREWSGADPDEPQEHRQYFRKREQVTLTLSHSGKININRLFSRTLKYDLSYTNDYNHAYSYQHMNVGGGPYLDSTEEGTYADPMIFPNSYSTKGGTRSRPITYYAKVANTFFLNASGFRNNINTGVEFRSEGNEGIGRYDVSDHYSDVVVSRLKPYSDYPYLTQLSAYAEDNMSLSFGGGLYPNLKVQAGLRWSMIQPGRTESMQTLSPRINSSFNPAEWLSLRFGYGIMEKTPSLRYLYPDPLYYDFYNINVSGSNDERFILYTTRIFDLQNLQLKPMRNTKYEAGFDIKLKNGMKFSVVGYWEKINNGFAYDNSQWVALRFDTWSGSDVWFENGRAVYDPDNPTVADSVVLSSVSRPGNTGYQYNKGVEFDFDLGKIKATNTAFYLSGAYLNTTYRSQNKQYKGVGQRTVSDVYVVYPSSSYATEDYRQVNTVLRVVQHIPAIRFIVSASAQFILYEYQRTLYASEYPEGYLKAASDWGGETRGAVVYVPFTQEELLRAAAETSATPPDQWVTFEGYRLKDQILSSITTNYPKKWPVLWCMNVRVTKEISDHLGFSFYMNNFFFHQPWQTSSNTYNPVERNSNLFSYGLEMSLKF